MALTDAGRAFEAEARRLVEAFADLLAGLAAADASGAAAAEPMTGP